jgi:PRTRC genetic system ThiF family protein
VSNILNPLQLNLFDLSILNAKPIYFNYNSVRIYLVGCGGTGSFLVPHLCRIANFLYDTGKRITITLVDFDSVEEKNLWRQNFCSGELGYNKAQALAMRYKTMFPRLNIGVVEKKVDEISLNGAIPIIVIGCVDNAGARKSIEDLMIDYVSLMAHGYDREAYPSGNRPPCWWLDCGNAYTYGQVAIGNWYSVELDDYKLEPATCLRLPLPTIQYPQLLQQTEEDETLSCAEQAILNGQSLNINAQMAIIAGEMVHQLLNSQLKRMRVEVDIFRGSIKSTFISQENINQLIEKVSKNLI